MEYRYHEVRCSHGFLVDAKLCPECFRRSPVMPCACDGRAKVDVGLLERALDFITEHPGSSFRRVAAGLDIHIREANRAVRALVGRGLVASRHYLHGEGHAYYVTEES